MRKNRERIFRFPFDIDTRVFLALALLFFIFSIHSIQQILRGTNHISQVAEWVEKDIQKNVEDARKNLTVASVTHLLQTRFVSKEVPDLLQKPYYIYVYKDNDLIFWNQNQIVPKTDCDSVISISSANGEFVQVPLHGSYPAGTHLFILIPIEKKITSSGREELVAFHDENNYGFDIQRERKAGAVPIHVEHSSPYFIVRKNSVEEIYDPYGWKLFLSALPFIFMGISIHTYFKVALQFRNKLVIWFSVIGFALVVRGLTLYTGFPNNFSEFRPFNPSVFYHDYLNCSLGDSFINVCLLFWILLFYIMNIQGLQSLEKLFNKGKVLVYIKMTALILLCLFQVRLMEQMILHSQIVFDTTRFMAVDQLTFIGILTFMVAMANILLSTYIISNRFNILQSNKWLKYILLLVLYLLFIFFGRAYVSSSSVHFLFPLLAVLLLLMDEKRMRIKFDFNSYELILWIICFSLLITSFFIYSIEQKEKNDRLNYAKSLLKETNVNESAQSLFNLHTQLEKELSAYQDTNFSSLQNHLAIHSCRQLLSNYEVTLINNGETHPAQILPSLDHYETIYNASKTDSLLAYQTVQEMNFYFPIHAISDSTNRYSLHLRRIILPMKNTKHEIDFSVEDSRYADYEYGIGIYSDSILTGNNGYHLLPSVIHLNSLFAKQASFLKDTLSRSELWYHNSQGQTIVVAKNKNVFSRFLTLFAVLFFIYFIVISFYILGNIIARSNLGKKRFMNLLNLNLRLRIHGTILITMLFAFIAVGYFTSYYLISQYRNSTSEKAVERMTSVKSFLFPAYKNLHTAEQMMDTLFTACHRISDDIGAPISLFDLNSGKLLFSTSYLLNNVQFPVQHIAPEALQGLLSNGSDYFALHEKQPDQDYYNTFSVVQSPVNDTRFILQIPYHQSSIYFKQETFSVIVTLINTFVVVFLISAFISLLLTNSVVEPFKFIMKRFTKINLAGTNEPLPWKYSDEMGVLVREYNRMLRTLENRTQLLARSEREMAWREMAKQVAHEIKNPMTPMKLSLQLLEKAIKEKKGNIVEMAERMTKTMIEQIDTLTVIATNFSTFARMPENKNEVMLLNDVLTAVTGMYTNDQQIEYDFALPQYPVYIFADKTQLIRVFTNIIQNAIQSIPESGKGMISLSVQKVKNNFIRVSISDNGIGIPKEKGEKLFQPYFTTKSSGTGLGLAMCKDIIEQLNGHISYESMEGEGTTFFIELPIFDME